MNYREEQRERAVKLREELFRDPGDGLFKNIIREFVFPVLTSYWIKIRLPIADCNITTLFRKKLAT